MKFSPVDFSKLESSLDSNKTYKLADVQHRLVKVAFDVVRFMDGDDVKSLWKIEKGDDGEYIVANYQTDEGIKLAESEMSKSASGELPVNDWQVILNKSASEIQLFYKKTPVTKLSSLDLGLPSNELNLVPKYLPAKLASDKSFAKKMISFTNEEYQKELFTKHPELL